MTRSSLSLSLAEWTLALRCEDLPELVVADVKLRVLDTLGLVISGAGTPMGRAVQAASGGLGSGRRIDIARRWMAAHPPDRRQSGVRPQTEEDA